VTLHNLTITYEILETTLVPANYLEGMVLQIHQHIILSSLKQPIDPSWLVEHYRKMKEITKFLEKFRTTKGTNRRLSWPHYDRAHNLGLLLHLLDKGENLPNKPSANLSKILCQMDEKIWLQEPIGNAVVYYAFSSMTNEDYVGQTTQFIIRKHRETWDARHYLRLLQQNNPKRFKSRRVDRRMASAGYQTWYHVPIRILGTDTTTDIRLSNEKQCITWLRPALNNNHMWRRRKCLLTPLRNQRPLAKYGNNPIQCSHFKLHCRICTKQATTRSLTIFTTIYSQESKNAKHLKTAGPDLTKLLKQYKAGDKIIIQKNNAFHDLTDYPKLSDNYGRSQLHNNHKLPIKLFMKDLAQLETYKITITIVAADTFEQKTDKQILAFCNTTKKWRKHLNTASLENLIYLWTRITKIEDVETKKKGLAKIRFALKKKVNIHELPQNLVILPYTEEIRKQP